MGDGSGHLAQCLAPVEQLQRRFMAVQPLFALDLFGDVGCDGQKPACGHGVIRHLQPAPLGRPRTKELGRGVAPIAPLLAPADLAFGGRGQCAGSREMREQLVKVLSDDVAVHPGVGRPVFLVAIDQAVVAVEKRHHGRDGLKSQRQRLPRAFALSLGHGDFGHVETGAAIACQLGVAVKKGFARHVDLPRPPIPEGQNQPQVPERRPGGQPLLKLVEIALILRQIGLGEGFAQSENRGFRIGLTAPAGQEGEPPIGVHLPDPIGRAFGEIAKPGFAFHQIGEDVLLIRNILDRGQKMHLTPPVQAANAGARFDLATVGGQKLYILDHVARAAASHMQVVADRGAAARLHKALALLPHLAQALRIAAQERLHLGRDINQRALLIPFQIADPRHLSRERMFRRADLCVMHRVLRGGTVHYHHQHPHHLPPVGQGLIDRRPLGAGQNRAREIKTPCDLPPGQRLFEVVRHLLQQVRRDNLRQVFAHDLLGRFPKGGAIGIIDEGIGHVRCQKGRLHRHIVQQIGQFPAGLIGVGAAL